ILRAFIVEEHKIVKKLQRAPLKAAKPVVVVEEKKPKKVEKQAKKPVETKTGKGVDTKAKAAAKKEKQTDKKTAPKQKPQKTIKPKASSK
ncbi:hypothetical protein HMI55_002150, partial [Coelomomyces lativittatus]